MRRSIRFIVFMGVSGAGKSTIALRVAAALGLSSIIEADDLHSQDNKQKMASGVPLTDEDRRPWLDALNKALRESSRELTVATCSALKRSYRERLACGIEGQLLFVFLDLSRTALMERVSQRRHEYMPGSLLDSQLETLEHPGPDEPVFSVSATGSVEETVVRIVEHLRKLP